jgi:hypothetical protein
MPEDEDGPAFRSGGHAYEPLLAPSPAPAPPSTDTVAVAEGEALKRGEVVEFKLATWGENWTPALSPPKRARVSRSQGGELTLEMDEGSPLEIPQRELRELRRVVAGDSQDSAALAEPEALEEAQAPPADSVARRTRSRSASDAALPAPKRRAPAPPLSPISSPSVSEVRKGSKSSRKRPRKAAGGAAAAPAPVRRRTKTTPAVKGGPNDTTAPAPAPAVEEKKSPKRRRARKKNGPKSPVPFSPTLPPVDAALEAKKAKLLELAK